MAINKKIIDKIKQKTGTETDKYLAIIELLKTVDDGKQLKKPIEKMLKLFDSI